MNQLKMIELLKKNYPKAWFKTSEEHGDGIGQIVSGESSFVDLLFKVVSLGNENEMVEIPLFDYYNEHPSLYTSGCYNELFELLKLNNWSIDWIDAGTVVIYPE